MDTEPYIRQVSQYILQQRQQGVPVMAIRNQLRRNGWQEALVNEAFRRVTTPSPYEALHITPSPGELPPQQIHGHAPIKGLKVKIGLVLVVLVLCIALGLFVSLTAKKKSGGGQQPANASQAGQGSSGTVIKAANDEEYDARSLMGGFSEYVNENGGQTPKNITETKQAKVAQFCGDTCDKPVKVNLKHYKPSEVSFQTYQSGLQPPDDRSLYIVVGSTCSKDHTQIALNTNANTTPIAFIYAFPAKDQTFTVQCLSL